MVEAQAFHSLWVLHLHRGPLGVRRLYPGHCGPGSRMDATSAGPGEVSTSTSCISHSAHYSITMHITFIPPSTVNHFFMRVSARVFAGALRFVPARVCCRIEVRLVLGI
ncbi:hypothetical protein CY34DRAFT_722698 [Suillus luteus UH-Slu-Lm8-n1]|uniref:Uncharacterized protein n=1 Tax=Suillus luteus UH-Slu-Lm8-n1 TaxID=930992 RepID=A0A0D0BAB8_9AGAM|nr:hypothetical protein CY34DRAFT_722698 [Suillus luteus UH-Slu-Lm8-n1]